MPLSTRARLSLGALYLVSGLVLLGGIGDLFITELLDVQRAFLSGGGAHPVSPPAARGFLEVLHAMAGGLIGVGSAGLLLVHFGLRRGHRWAGLALGLSIGFAEGANTVGMLRLGSPFWMVTATYLGLLATGLSLAYLPTFAFDREHP